MMDVDVLTEHVLGLEGIEGVTFTGGEPFTQAAALGELGRNLQKHGLNIVTFSGFPYSYLREKNRCSWRLLLRVTDLLIAGPYTGDGGLQNPMVASSNQSMVFLTDRLKDRISAEQPYRDVELCIGPGGDIAMTGFPDRALLKELHRHGRREGDVYVPLQQTQNQN
jgi:anaerobic ribonucleoside-triphosphate reductase activating protein